MPHTLYSARSSAVRQASRRPLAIDIGGEGRYACVWNVNPSRTRTLGPRAGQIIPRLIVARADALPLRDASVDVAVVERTPLRRQALIELRRVVVPRGWIILRHVPLPNRDRHALALQLIAGRHRQRPFRLDGMLVQETIIRPHPTPQQPSTAHTPADPEALQRLLFTLGVDVDQP